MEVLFIFILLMSFEWADYPTRNISSNALI